MSTAPEKKSLNIEMSLLKAFGIIGVVVSHHINSVPAFFPTNSFVIPLFFFASGYFYAPKIESKPLLYLEKRAFWFFTVFYVYHLFHALELYVLWQNGIKLGWGAPTFPQFIYYPFQTMSSYGLGFPMWFVMQLFVGQIVYLAIRMALRSLRINDHIYLAAFFALALVSVMLSPEGGFPDTTLPLILLRTAFCLFFLHAGYYFRVYIEPKNIFTSKILTAVLIIQAIVVSVHPQVVYTVGSMWFRGYAIVPFIVTFTALYGLIYLAKILATHITEDHILCRIGKNTFHIAALHMSFCFIIVLLLRAYYGAHDAITDPLYSYQTVRFWTLYNVVGVLAPVFFIEAMRRLKNRLKASLRT